MKCRALCCDDPATKVSGGRWCRRHAKHYRRVDEYGTALRERIAAHASAKHVSSYLDVEAYGWIYEVQTIAGRMEVTFHQGSYALYCRFDDPDKAKGLAGVNPHSGKWNVHIADEHPINSAVLYTLAHIKRAIPDLHL